MVGYGKEFGILDKVTEGQYLAVLCRIFGYKNQSPVTVEGPARELGLLQSNDVVNITSNLKRATIAKYTVRAFEKLNTGTTYPDYLEAYQSMALDYESLSGEMKPIVLKCIEKGLLAGGADGNFSPNDYTTRAQAAAFIHRLMEQSERDKVKPIFATPDAEFEAFMNSPEADNYVCTDKYIKVQDGKIIWNEFGETTPLLIANYYNKDINKEVYNMMKILVNYARKNGHYVHAHISLFADPSATVVVQYYGSKLWGGEYGEGYPNFRLYARSFPYKLFSGISQKHSTDYTWDIVSLGNSATHQFTEEERYRTKATLEEFKAPLRELYKSIYPPDVAAFIYNHMMNEWNANWDMVVNNNFEENVFVRYYPDMGLEIHNNRSENTMHVYFGTNDID